MHVGKVLLVMLYHGDAIAMAATLEGKNQCSKPIESALQHGCHHCSIAIVYRAMK